MEIGNSVDRNGKTLKESEVKLCFPPQKPIPATVTRAGRHTLTGTWSHDEPTDRSHEWQVEKPKRDSLKSPDLCNKPRNSRGLLNRKIMKKLRVGRYIKFQDRKKYGINWSVRSKLASKAEVGSERHPPVNKSSQTNSPWCEACKLSTASDMAQIQAGPDLMQI